MLVKQVPRAETFSLLPSGRLNRDGVELEMNAYCRRAVSKGVELAKSSGGTCTVFTLGPPSAEDALREAVAWGADEGILVTDPVFAGSDTLATARAMACAIETEGPFDLVMLGRNSIDADTGQVPPELAELLDLPFAGGVKEIVISGSSIEARCELDDGWKVVSLEMPALLSVAERLCEPAKVDPEGRAAVDPGRIRRVGAADLGSGPFGQAGSPTRVGDVRVMEVSRRRVVLRGSVKDQVAEAVSLLRQWGALAGTGRERQGQETVREAFPEAGDPIVAVVVEPGRSRLARELLGEAAQLAAGVGGSVVSIGPGEWPSDELYSWGADRGVVLRDALTEEDVAAALAGWASARSPWAVLVPGTLWGREVAGRCAARLGAGLTGDAVGLGVADGRLVAWKPAFGGMLVAAITTSSPVQMATVRPGVLDLRVPRAVSGTFEVELIASEPRRRVAVLSEGRDDDVEALMSARVVVGVGAAIVPNEYERLRPLTDLLDAELAASRKVTDKGWLPRARQVGITGHSVAPALCSPRGSGQVQPRDRDQVRGCGSRRQPRSGRPDLRVGRRGDRRGLERGRGRSRLGARGRSGVLSRAVRRGSGEEVEAALGPDDDLADLGAGPPGDAENDCVGNVFRGAEEFRQALLCGGEDGVGDLLPNCDLDGLSTGSRGDRLEQRRIEVTSEARGDRTRHDGRHLDGIVDQFAPKRVRDAVHRMLGRAVDARVPPLCGDRGDVHDVSRLPAVAHRADCRLTTGEEPEHVGLEHLAPVFGVSVGDRFRIAQPRVVDDDVEPAGRRSGPRYEVRHFAGVAHVDSVVLSGAARSFDLAHGRRHRIGGPPGQHHVGVFGPECLSDRAAYATRSARNHSRPTFQESHRATLTAAVRYSSLISEEH